MLATSEMVYAALKILVGNKLLATNNVGDMRCFHFGSWLESGDTRRAQYGLQILCAWRLEDAERIITGRHDYFVRADDNNDPGWEPGSIRGHLQDQNLQHILGGYDQDYDMIVNTSNRLIVESVLADTYGGFDVHLSGGYRLVAFPTNSREEDWRLIREPGQRHFVVSGGAPENN